jgi:hypothetical protein
MTVDLQVLCEQFRELKPPQLRDRQIFEAVAVKQRSQTEVAREHGISQPRVAQILVEVGAWVARVVPQALDQLTQEERLGLATFLVESQLRYWQDLATAAWTKGGDEKVVRKVIPQKDGSIIHEETVIPQGRKIGLLSASMRLALALARLAGVDTSGRTQRMAAMAEAAARRANGANVGRPSQAVPNVEAQAEDGLGSPSYEAGAEAEKELIGQTGNSAATEPAGSSQDECLSLDTRFHWTLEEEREAGVKRLMKVLREDEEEPVTVSDEELRGACEQLWENEFRAEAEKFHRMKHHWYPHLVGSAPRSEPPAGRTATAPPLSEPQATSDTRPLAIHEPLEQIGVPDSHPGPPTQPMENISSRLPRGERRRLRREWERRRAQANRRQFFAPIAAG